MELAERLQNVINEKKMEYLKLVPAYGRDYKTEAEVLDHWDHNLDFKIVDGSYINKMDFIRLRDRHPIQTVKYIHFRYDKLQKVKVIKVTEETLNQNTDK